MTWQNQGLFHTDTITYSELSVSSQLGSFPAYWQSFICSTVYQLDQAFWVHCAEVISTFGNSVHSQHINRASCNSGEEARPNLVCPRVLYTRPHELSPELSLWKRSDLVSLPSITEIYDMELSFVSWLCVSVIRFIVHGSFSRWVELSAHEAGLFVRTPCCSEVYSNQFYNSSPRVLPLLSPKVLPYMTD